MTVLASDREPVGGRPVAPTRGALRPLGLTEVRIVGGFWGRRQHLSDIATIDHGRVRMQKVWTRG